MRGQSLSPGELSRLVSYEFRPSKSRIEIAAGGSPRESRVLLLACIVPAPASVAAFGAGRKRTK